MTLYPSEETRRMKAAGYTYIAGDFLTWVMANAPLADAVRSSESRTTGWWLRPVTADFILRTLNTSAVKLDDVPLPGISFEGWMGRINRARARVLHHWVKDPEFRASARALLDLGGPSAWGPLVPLCPDLPPAPEAP